MHTARGGLGILGFHEFSKYVGDHFGMQSHFVELGIFWLFQSLRGLPAATAGGFDPGGGLGDGRRGIDLDKISSIANVHARYLFGGFDQPFVIKEADRQLGDHGRGAEHFHPGFAVHDQGNRLLQGNLGGLMLPFAFGVLQKGDFAAFHKLTFPLPG